MNPIRETVRAIIDEDDSIEDPCNRIPALYIDEWGVGVYYSASIQLLSQNTEEVEDYTMFEVINSNHVRLLGPYSDDEYHPWRDL